ncbi:MAG: potassium transporter TrkA [Spirochaetales bacterium]|nr:potassium transporter TrkA [Spirochaetales bacterium]
MVAILTFYVILVLSNIILRIATSILRFTGLSHDVAYFQARSAFTGTGYTTRESEIIVNHPLRRRVILLLMFVRNIGFITVISSIILSFFDTQNTEEFIVRIAWLVGGTVVLIILARIKFIDILLSKVVEISMRRWKKIYVQDYESLLNLSGEFEIIDCLVAEGSWLANKALSELRLIEEGVLVLGITRDDGYFVGIPKGSTRVYTQDRVILYGREDLLRKLGRRKTGKAGDQEHQEEVTKMLKWESKQIKQEKPKGVIKNVLKRIFKPKKK